MASKAKSTSNNWLVLDKFETEIWFHANGRYVEIGHYDHRAPKERRWIVTIIDRESGKTATAMGELKFDTRDEAFKQVGGMADSVARNLGAA